MGSAVGQHQADRPAAVRRESVLRVSGLVRRYGSVVAVDNVNFEIAAGETLSLLGPSGCGKSTTLRAIAGLDEIDGGEVYLGGRLVASAVRGINLPPEKRNVGLVFQSYAVWPHMSVFDNVAYPLRARRLRSAEVRRRVHDILELIGLPELAQRRANQLSGGQQQRVALARALVYEPDLVLLDEPLSNLDAARRHSVRLHLRELQARLGISMLFVTHDETEALTLSSRVAVMRHGRIEQVADPKTLYETPQSPFVFLTLGHGFVFRGRLERSAGMPFFVLGDVRIPIRPPVLPIGSEVDAGFRPAEVHLVAQPDSPSDIPTVIDQTVFLGDHLECVVRIADHRVRLREEATTAWRAGDHAWLRIPAEAVRIWPTTTEAASELEARDRSIHREPPALRASSIDPRPGHDQA